MNAIVPASQAEARVAVGARVSESETSTEAATYETLSSGPATIASKRIAFVFPRPIAAVSIRPTETPSASERHGWRPYRRSVSATNWPTVRVSGGNGAGLGCGVREVPLRATARTYLLGTRDTRVATTPALRQAKPESVPRVRRNCKKGVRTR
jgi:hypothetical protein